MTTTSEAPSGAFNYFVPLGVDKTFGRVFHVFSERWVAFTGIAFVVYFVGWIFAILLNLVLGNDIRIDGFSSNYGYVYELQSWDEILFYVIEGSLFYVFACVAHGAAIWVTAHVYLHQSPHPYDAFQVAFEKCWPLVAATILLGLIFQPVLLPTLTIGILANNGSIDPVLGAVLMFLLIFALGTFLTIVTYVMYAAIMVDKKGPWESIKHSYHLTKGNWGYILAILLLWAIVKVLLSMMITPFLVMGIMRASRPMIWIANTLDTVISIFLLAIAPVFEGVIYFNLRVQKEELDSVKLGEEIGIEEGSYITMVPPHDPTPVEDPKEPAVLA
eukprot:CAMPEP_0197182892 /NCGR_PEP_ID=MMETSP1423-20130617/7005_1 /TAXON_ID=476441 /ORGANISM="Pseudo-nitzschia heimii, Strain UNC1101" /LENGTH=329 /DNA_ID=CAMNT_0042633395 /DNA_START=37 /DNA_END=1026 /DNA_ORIENTATION=-